MKTRLLTLLAVLMCSMTMFAEILEGIKIGDLYYNLNTVTRSATVNRVPGGEYSGDIVIPSTVQYSATTYYVRLIGANAFKNCREMTSVTLPDSIVNIGEQAFFCCYGLTSIEIPNTVVVIQELAFAGCVRIPSINIPSSVKTIGSWAFLEVPHIEYYGTAEGAPWGALSMNDYNQEIYTEYDASTQTLTYYYDNLRPARKGVTEKYEPDSLRFVDYHDKVTKAVIDPSMKDAPLTTMKRMFYGGYSQTDTDSSTDYYCLTKLTTIEGMENLNTSNVTSMYYTFFRCGALKSLDLSTFDTSNVEDMEYMFYFCSSLTSLDLSSFNTSKVTNMCAMFFGCWKLRMLDITSFNVQKVTNLKEVFRNCPLLRTIYCDSDWNETIQPYVPSGWMFDYCKALIGGKGTTFNESVTDARYARPDGGHDAPGYFSKKGDCLVYSEFTDSTGTLTYYYDDKISARTGVTELYRLSAEAPRFEGYNDKVLKAVIDPSMKEAPLERMDEMFYGLSAMTAIEGLENLNTSNIWSMSYMFYQCKSLKSLNLSSFDTANVENMNDMFDDCVSLDSLDLSSFSTASLKDARFMFVNCENLKTLDLTSFDIPQMEYMQFMFNCCSKLQTIWCNYDWSSSTAQSNSMFNGCTALVGGKGTTFNENVIDATYAHPDGGEPRPGYFSKRPKVYTDFSRLTWTLTYYYDSDWYSRGGVTEFFDPINNPNAVRFGGYNNMIKKAVIDPSMKNAPLTSFEGMFYGGIDTLTTDIYNLHELTDIEGLENLNTSVVTDMNAMFFMCSALTLLDLSSFNTENVTDMSGMFMGCTNLQAVDLTSFNISNSKVENITMMFGGCSKLTTICCFDDWSQSTTVTNSNYMFSGCKALVGGKGTLFNSNVIDATYARPDGGTEAPGYFTAETITSIASPLREKEKGVVYDVSGRKLDKPQRGINIVRTTGPDGKVNVKKLLVK